MAGSHIEMAGTYQCSSRYLESNTNFTPFPMFHISRISRVSRHTTPVHITFHTKPSVT